MMDVESEINLLVSDILDGNNYGHCRLCLERIKNDQFARFDDNIAYSSTDECLPLVEILKKIFGEEVCKEITGINAICSNCLDRTLDTYNFILNYEVVTQRLQNVIDNLNETLNNVDITNQNQVLYIVCKEDYSQLLFVQNTDRRPTKISCKCSICKESFDDVEVLAEHTRDYHGVYTCKICTYTSENEADVSEHITSSSSYKCDICSQFCCTEDSLKEHEIKCHSAQVCKECGKSFKGLDKLLAHEQKHINKNECPKCGKTYTTKEFFEKHVKLCLEDRVDPHPMRSRIEKTYFCQKCDKGYSTPGGLRVHQRFVHGNAEHHVCKECGKKFTAPCYLKVHMVTHTREKNFPCDICEGRFVSKEALLYHRRRHTGEKPYTCDACGERFVNASARVEHIKFKHIGPTLDCKFCSRKFVTKNILRIHMKKHYDPTNKLYIGRADVPHNIPGEQSLMVAITE